MRKLVLLTAVLLAFTLPATATVRDSCNSGETEVLQLASDSNAHAFPPDSGKPYSVCIDDAFEHTISDTGAGGEPVLDIASHYQENHGGHVGLEGQYGAASYKLYVQHTEGQTVTGYTTGSCSGNCERLMSVAQRANAHSGSFAYGTTVYITMASENAPDVELSVNQGNDATDKEVQADVDVTPGTNDIDSCEISWGNGDTDTFSSSTSGPHTYPTDGTYTIEVRCTDTAGLTGRDQTAISVPGEDDSDDGNGGNGESGQTCTPGCESWGSTCDQTRTCTRSDCTTYQESRTTNGMSCSDGNPNTINTQCNAGSCGGGCLDTDGDSYCNTGEACPYDPNRYPGNYNDASCPDRYRWVCDGDTTRTQEIKRRNAPTCGYGCTSGSWQTYQQESPPGTQYECRDSDGDGGSDAEWVDVVPPTTTDTSDDQWHRQPQTIQLVCDDTGGSGCDSTSYCIDQTNECSPDQEGTSVTVTSEGTNYIRYRSTDNAGNTESIQTTEVKIDQTPPAIACEDCITPTATAIETAISIDPTATDQRSGLGSLTVCEDTSCSTIICSDPPCEYSKDEVYDTDIIARAIDSVGNVRTDNIGQATFKRPIGALCDTDEQCISQRCVQLQCAPENIAPGVDIRFDAIGENSDETDEDGDEGADE